jgi:hypothetical protein
MSNSKAHNNDRKPRIKKVIYSVVVGLLIGIFFLIMVSIITMLRNSAFNSNDIIAIIVLCGILAGLYFLILRIAKSKL